MSTNSKEMLGFAMFICHTHVCPCIACLNSYSSYTTRFQRSTFLKLVLCSTVRHHLSANMNKPTLSGKNISLSSWAMGSKLLKFTSFNNALSWTNSFVLRLRKGTTNKCKDMQRGQTIGFLKSSRHRFYLENTLYLKAPLMSTTSNTSSMV
jgi:hypothetical protein